MINIDELELASAQKVMRELRAATADNPMGFKPLTIELSGPDYPTLRGAIRGALTRANQDFELTDAERARRVRERTRSEEWRAFGVLLGVDELKQLLG